MTVTCESYFSPLTKVTPSDVVKYVRHRGDPLLMD